MSKREIKKTVISYEADQKQKHQRAQRQRSRQKKAKVEVVDANSRRARLAMMKNRRQQEEQINNGQQNYSEPAIRIQADLPKIESSQGQIKSNNVKQVKDQQRSKIETENDGDKGESEESEQQEQQNRVMLKPVFISKQNREEHQTHNNQKQQQRKKKALKYTTKLLILQNAKNDVNSDDEIMHSSDDQAQTNLPDDDDTKNQQYQYQLWKVRELKRIRRDKEQRRKIQKQKNEIERRRKMNNEEILLENKVMGSDATDNTTETKYVYLQKYYHKGAFYQDSDDAIFKRDYNMPTPLEMQDKSMLPEILQKRHGNFGKKGQSKYTHLTAEDTTNFDPHTRADESILASWKKKTAGYKGKGSNI